MYRLAFLLIILLLGSCNSDKQKASASESAAKEVILGKISLSDGWARPGSEGQSSAAYLSIGNGTASRDTIIGITSKAARKAAIHESYKGENGMIGMRPAPQQVIPSGGDLYLQPGGLHIMLTGLKRTLSVGDSLKLSVEFARAGRHSVTIPVKIQN